MNRRIEGAQPAAVVIGLDSVTGLQTARLLARRGIPVVGIARQRRHMACRTNACTEIVFSDTGGADLAATLERLRSAFAAPPVLFPCTDLAVLSVSGGREALAPWYRFVLPRPGVVERLLDKATFHAYALEAGLPTSPTRLLYSRLDAREAAEALRFPCVLKPAVKTPAWQSRTPVKLFKVAGAAEFLARYDECSQWAGVLIAQEWIDGPDHLHFTCNAYFDAESRPRLTYVSQKLRQWPLEGGVACLSRECRNEDVRQQTVALFGGAGHRGLAYLEMKFDARTGRHVIIEPNVGRPTGRSAAADESGVELLYTQYCDALGLPLPAVREQPHDARGWIYFRQDCQSAYARWRSGGVTMAGWLRSVRQCRGDAVFSWTDPRPFAADVVRTIRKAIRRRRQDARTGTPLSGPLFPRGDIALRVSPSPVDFDIHGLVGVRLVDASSQDAVAVARQLGPPGAPLSREPDIVVRFVERLPTEGLRWIEFERTGFAREEFFVQQPGRRRARARLAFEHIGSRLEIVCERGARSVPLLMALVITTALARGGVPLHASAFLHGGAGVLVTGWAKGGKTEALLAFAAHGAEYVGDEWILLTGGGLRMHGIPEYIRLQDWHLAQVPRARAGVPASRRALFSAIRLAERSHRLLSRGPLSRRFPATLLEEAMPALRRQLNVQLDPSRVFGARPHACAAPPDTVFFMISHDHPAVQVEPADPADVARRMAASVLYELLPLSSSYLAYRFAFPDRRSAVLDGLTGSIGELIAQSLHGKRTYVVRHPYPCRLESLFEAMAPLCGHGMTSVAGAAGPEPAGQGTPQGEGTPALPPGPPPHATENAHV